MNRRDAEFMFDAAHNARGVFHEKYLSRKGIADAYVLSLSGNREIGLERSGDKWHFWTSRFVKTYPIESLNKIIGRLKDAETGDIIRVFSYGETGNERSTYMFGTRLGAGVFLAIGDDSFDVWVTKPISF